VIILRRHSNNCRFGFTIHSRRVYITNIDDHYNRLQTLLYHGTAFDARYTIGYRAIDECVWQYCIGIKGLH
jgi:hypothetical protein